jgi:DNA-directed RNA polymerase sigma subunit (sigma70/sigma32)
MSSKVSSPTQAACLKDGKHRADISSVAQADLRRVERAAANAAKSREQLRVAITLARAGGETLGDIGRAAGLSRQRIAQILRGSR